MSLWDHPPPAATREGEGLVCVQAWAGVDSNKGGHSWSSTQVAQWQRIHLQCRRPGFDPWVQKIPWRRERLPTPVFWPREFHRLYSPWGRKESDRTERLSLSPRWLSGKESACHCRRLQIQRFDPWVGKIPWRRKWQPTPVFLMEKLWTEEPGGLRELDPTAHSCCTRLPDPKSLTLGQEDP